MTNKSRDIFWVRIFLFVVLLGVVFSCQMILFVEPQIQWMDKVVRESAIVRQRFPQLVEWIGVLNLSVNDTYQKYPAIAYCMDWLAFAHVFVGLSLLGAIKNPVQNVWAIKTAILTCLLMVPFAFLSGSVRGIPFYWCMVDSSFAVLALIPLSLAMHSINKLKQSQVNSTG